MGMAALNRRLESLVRPTVAPVAVDVDVDVDVEAEADPAMNTYFAPTPGSLNAMPTGMFIAFEGIDGSGKDDRLSNRVASTAARTGSQRRTRARGGLFASRVTQAIRDLCRDARNLALVARAELLLYVAREIQLAEEVVIPGLSRADVVITDRYLYTAEVLARQIRRLPDATIRAIIDDAAGGVWPDMVVLVDVDPSVARGRRKVAKLMSREQRPSSRKGLAGSGLGQRLREGYLSLAAGDPNRWIVVDNTDADLDELVTHVCDAIVKARAQGVQAAVASGTHRARRQRRPPAG